MKKEIAASTNQIKNVSDENFKFASSLIKIIAVVIALMVIFISKYAFILFSAAMLPTICAIFFDSNSHKCSSATICSFNLIGVLPFLIRLWNNSSIDTVAKMIIADVETWMAIYGAAFMGQLIYLFLPMLVVKVYTAKNQVQVSHLQEKISNLSKEWGIVIEDKKVP